MTITLTRVCMQGNKGSCCWLAFLLFCSSFYCKLKRTEECFRNEAESDVILRNNRASKNIPHGEWYIWELLGSRVWKRAWCSSLLPHCHLECRVHLFAHEMTTTRQRNRGSHIVQVRIWKNHISPERQTKKKNKKVTNRSQRSRITDSKWQTQKQVTETSLLKE